MDINAIDVFLDGLNHLPFHKLEDIENIWMNTPHNKYTNIVVPYIIGLKLDYYEENA